MTSLDQLVSALKDGANSQPAATQRVGGNGTCPLFQRAAEQDVGALLAASPEAVNLDAESRERLLEHVRAQAIHAAALDADLRRLLDALHASGLAPIVIKGAHLAHAIYPHPSLRPRADTDLLIPVRDRERMAAALARNGFTPAALTSGTVILGQFLYQKTLGPGITHYVDVHWRAAAPLVFGDAFDAAAICAASVPIPALGASARGPAPPDALALACVHLVAHHWPSASLLWLYDLRLLADALDGDGRDQFARAAAAGKYRQVAICALERARAVFPAPSLDAAIDRLHRMSAGHEPSAALTSLRRRPLLDFWLDLRVAGWRRGSTLIKEHLLPPPAYMRMAFGDRALPLAYAARLIRAVSKRL